MSRKLGWSFLAFILATGFGFFLFWIFSPLNNKKTLPGQISSNPKYCIALPGIFQSHKYQGHQCYILHGPSP